MLRALGPQRSKIGDMMVFCIEHADSWEEIVECITDSLCISETPLYKKIARLFLVSDILHNCSVKVSNVSNYRKGFQSKLPDIFQSFYQSYNQIEGRLKAEQFKVFQYFYVKLLLTNFRFIIATCNELFSSMGRLGYLFIGFSH
ncbi:hypothetical protein BLA29_012015 [Euroglyphus maynei]|uniref:CID domain-containing protein n=1 Tax=Euroglyphus maynei TaxID=6958 RepID=A0A1Y3BRJ7_EURMA|nr:hypothetical protein BLA29_012015 [Euroglyphus maynei]